MIDIANGTSGPVEIIGMHAEIIGASNHDMIGVDGTITYETKNMIHVSEPMARHNYTTMSQKQQQHADTYAHTRRIPKKGTVMHVWNQKKSDGPYVLDCSAILKRPHERKEGRPSVQ